MQQEGNQTVLSFCIPTFNRAQRVYECVKHILQYPGDEIEVVVSNNASTDNTLELLDTIDDGRLKVYSNEENIGALNWPLVISYANSQWAALMSDEDIVCLDNIPHFISLLNKAKTLDVGVIMYHFPPANMIWDDYLSERIDEGFKLAIARCGHITGHIINKEFFDVEPYKAHFPFYSEFVKLYRKFFLYSKSHDLTYMQKPRIDLPYRMMEPQQTIVLDIARQHYVWMVHDEIVLYGKEHCDTYTEKEFSIDKNFNAFSPELNFMTFMSLCEYIYKGFSNYNDNTVLLFTSLLRVVTTVSIHCTWFSSNHGKIRKKVNNDKEVIVTFFEHCMQHLTTIQSDFNWNTLTQHFNNAIFGHMSDPYPLDLDFYYRVLLGNVCFYAIYFYHKPPMYGESEPKDNNREWHDSFTDVYELRKTDNLLKAIKAGNYDTAIEDSSDIQTFRAKYLLGIAYYFKGDYKKSINCFEMFLSHVDNPQCLNDIIISLKSIQLAYYYLGCCNQKLGRYSKAVEHFSKCSELTENLLLGEMLTPYHIGPWV